MKHFALDTMVQDPKFAGEAQALRDKLAAMLNIIDTAPTPGENAVVDPVADARTVAVQVRAILKARRRRAHFFDASLFADPAWDMLLELYAAELSGYRLSVSNLCLAAAVPVTTALRWLKYLEEKGLARRTPDPVDGRRVFISLPDAGREAMSGFMRTLAPSVPLI